MLSKKFYDIFALLLIVLFIGSIWYVNDVNSKVFRERWEASDKSDAIAVTLETNADYRVITANYIYLGAKVLSGIFWIFVVVLAIQLHKLKLASMLDVIIIVVLVPLAVVFYFVTLRGKLKKTEASS